MSQLSYALREIQCPNGKNATVVELNGSVDPGSIDDFDSIFDELIEGGNVRIVMDLANLKYINSTGMGMMVQYYDQLCDEGGGLVLLTVQAKIILVLEMLGLQELFPIVATEEEAIASLMGEKVKPANVEVKMEESAVGDFRGGMAIECGSCGAGLIAAGAGTYVCPRCKAALKVSDFGTTETYPESGSGVVELVIPAEVPFFKSAAALMARLGIKAGLPDTGVMEVAQTLQSALTSMTSNCLCGGSDNDRLHLIANSDISEFTVGIYCAGRQIADPNAVEGNSSGFDTVKYEEVIGGNLLTLKKCF